MPKNVLFLLKNCKNLQTLGALPPELSSPAAGGSAPRPPRRSHPTLWVFHFASAHKARNQPNDLIFL